MISIEEKLISLAQIIGLERDNLRAIIKMLSENNCLKTKISIPVEDVSDYRCIRDAWNENCGGLPKVLRLNDSRKKHMQARWKEYPDKQVWIDAVKSIASSDFHNGKNESKWIADFDYFIKPKTILGLMEKKKSKTGDKSDLW